MITSSLRSVGFSLSRRKADGRRSGGRSGGGPLGSATTTRCKARPKRGHPPRTVAALRLAVVGICRPSIRSDTSSSNSSQMRLHHSYRWNTAGRSCPLTTRYHFCSPRREGLRSCGRGIGAVRSAARLLVPRRGRRAVGSARRRTRVAGGETQSRPLMDSTHVDLRAQ